ncbi:hypothetical protein PZ938_13965 [Luteipulveratus sp. YIM 133132]|uniref:hypothetical protein n=1 Tax=Luteipulveratus flavus TaxID=3031728 RepID=UPI0023B18100|nr:hypothetical protein [Luteipulveratus sp. YIM 133132]MDE9366715.1 hypothetical protein [Luteipulveratus sp. YIM 133132]
MDHCVYRFEADDTPVGVIIFGELMQYDEQGLRFRAYENATIERVRLEDRSTGWRAEGTTFPDEVCFGARGRIVHWPGVDLIA